MVNQIFFFNFKVKIRPWFRMKLKIAPQIQTEKY